MLCLIKSSGYPRTQLLLGGEIALPTLGLWVNAVCHLLSKPEVLNWSDETQKRVVEAISLG